MSNMTFDEIQTVDVSECDTAFDAAQAAADVVRDAARAIGHDPESEVFVREKFPGAYVVGYEAGPSFWAVNMVGGEGFFGSDPQIDGLRDPDGFAVDAEYSFALAFYGH